jgi:Flp pilus assembly protein TadG
MKNQEEIMPFSGPGEDKPQIKCGSCRKRRGAAAVEFALVAPLFFLLIFGMIEFGRMIMVQQVLTNASREGARKAVLDGSSVTDVNNTVIAHMADASITVANGNITITKNGTTITDLANQTTYGDPISVRVSVPFSQVSWLPTSFLLNWFGRTDIDLKAATVMRRETVQQ